MCVGERYIHTYIDLYMDTSYMHIIEELPLMSKHSFVLEFLEVGGWIWGRAKDHK